MQDQVEDEAEQLFEQALGLDESLRAAFLEAACGNRPGLRPRVDRLLAEDSLAGSFLNHPLFPGRPSPDANRISEAGQAAPTTANVATPAADSQFRHGDLLSNRFLVIRFIARGGMGEVYEVEDRQLRGVHLALKTILAQFASDPTMHDRFEREVLLAREVVHPNLCPIYDLFHWDRPEGRLTFLTMRLLPGETLSARLNRLGPLPLPEAAVIVNQVAAGLTAAHQADILHRDIKASNVMLHGSGDRLHACVTDFGLARAMLSESTALTVGGIAGTPAYMAPELFYGDPPSKASDVFALGVMTFQMLTGRLPRKSIPPGIANPGLAQPSSAQPRRFKPNSNGTTRTLPAEFPAPWRNFVDGCVEPDQGRRFQTIPEALAALNPAARFAITSHAPTWLTRRRLLASLISAGAAATTAAATGAFVERERIHDGILDWLHPLPLKRAVALMAWPTGESAAVVTTVLESIGQRLARAEAYTKDLLVISARDLHEPGATVANPTDSVGMLGANLVLAASLQLGSATSRLTLQLMDAGSQQILRSKELTFATAELSSVAERASETAARLLGLPLKETPFQDQEELRRVAPEVYKVFSEAEQLAAQPNDTGMEAALLKYQQAVEMDPHFALGYAQLAITYVKRYLLDKDDANLTLAQSNATLARTHNPNSAKALFSQGLVYLYSPVSKNKSSTSEDPERKAEEYFDRSLKVDPTNPDTLFYLAQALRDKGDVIDVRRAKQLYKSISALRPGYWPAYDELGFMLYEEWNYKGAAEAYSAAVAAAPKAAWPLANLASMYVALNELDKAKDACYASLKLGPTDTAYYTLGDMDFLRGDYQSAAANFQRAVELSPRSHDLWRDIGDCDAMLGHAAQMKRDFAKAAKVLSETTSGRKLNGETWATLAFYHAKAGDKETAQSDLKHLKAPAIEEGNTNLLAAQALAVLGQREPALNLLIHCVKQGISTEAVDLAVDLKDLRTDPRYKAELTKLKPQS